MEMTPSNMCVRSLNTAAVSGHITSEPIFRKNGRGIDYCNFIINIPPRTTRDKPTILAVKANKTLAQKCFVEMNLTKGAEVSIRGRLVNHGQEPVIELLATRIVCSAREPICGTP